MRLAEGTDPFGSLKSDPPGHAVNKGMTWPDRPKGAVRPLSIVTSAFRDGGADVNSLLDGEIGNGPAGSAIPLVLPRTA